MTLESLLSMFDLSVPFSDSDLQAAKKKVLMLHPDKHVRHPEMKHHYLKYLDGYKKLEAVYRSTRHAVSSDDIPIDDTFKNYIDKKSYKKKDFLKHFNHMFENIHVKSGDEAYGYEQWIQSNEDIYDKDIETSRQMLMKELVVLKEPVPEQVFGKVYSDLKEAHKHSIIAIDEEKVFRETPKFKNVQDYQIHREQAIDHLPDPKQILQQEYKKNTHDSLKLAYEYKEREEQMEKKQKDYNSRFFKLDYI
jgi:hypothetical protein